MASVTFYSYADEEFPKEQPMSTHDRGCCFWMPCTHCHRLTFSAESDWWQTIANNDDKVVEDTRCWSKGILPFKKIKEWSQLVVKPKMKTFIRQFNGNTPRCRHGKFQYDPTSYMLNFDEGLGYLEDDDQTIPNFSTRYSSILVPGKPPMNLGAIGLSYR